jgi:riboflavin kinase / FMN adenylyltransferase
MIVLRALHELSHIRGPVVLACGVFDGVHLGHQAVLRAAKEKAAELNARAVVLTFDPHPAKVLRPESAPPRLCSAAHELLILQRFGMEAVVVCPFNQERADQPAEEFLDEITRHCTELRAICVGEDWRFGRDRRGDITTVKRCGEQLGFEAVPVPLLKLPGIVVSSTQIRQAIAAGDLGRARQMLGRNYSVYGMVIHGNALARTLGFPTANIAVENEQLPPAGVYAVTARWQDKLLPGVANLGHRPTITPHNQTLSLEVHLFDFDSDLYGEMMEIDFLHRLRDEQKFSGLDALKAQIATDTQQARDYFRLTSGSEP